MRHRIERQWLHHIEKRREERKFKNYDNTRDKEKNKEKSSVFF